MPSTPLYITDHALLRYIERIHGVDVETLRAELRAKALRGAGAAERIGGGRIHHHLREPAPARHRLERRQRPSAEG